MPSYQEQRVLPYTAAQMFDLVIAVDEYPEFLPWCLAARINERGDGFIDADVVVGYQLFREKFSSHVTYTQNKEIEVDYRHGPLQHLSNHWQFQDVDGGCEVSFFVEFDFKSSVFQVLMNKFFDKAVQKMISAFEQRAAELYGEKQHA